MRACSRLETGGGGGTHLTAQSSSSSAAMRGETRETWPTGGEGGARRSPAYVSVRPSVRPSCQTDEGTYPGFAATTARGRRHRSHDLQSL